MLRQAMIVTGLLLAASVSADQFQAIPESASGLIYPGDEVGGEILLPDAGWDGDFGTFTEAASNGSGSNAITWETTEIYRISEQAQNVRLHFKTEQYHDQSSSEVYLYNFPADQYDRLFIESGPDDAPLLSEETLTLDPPYVSNGEIRVRVVLFAKHSSSAYARYYESEIVYMVPVGQINAVIVDPVDADLLYVAANRGWKSADGGLGWTQLNIAPTWGPGCCSWIGSMIMDPDDRNALYAGPGNGFYNIWKTVDGGSIWNVFTIDPAIVANGATNLTVSAYAIDPVADLLYASAYSGGPGMPIVSDVYASADGGANWQRTNLDYFADDLAFDPVNARLFAATTEGIFVYEGAGWTQIGLVGENATDVAIAPNDPLTVYAGLGHTGVGGTEAAGLWKGVYNGTWQWSDISIDLGMGPVRVASIAIDPVNSNVIYAGSQWSNGLFKSTDGGTSWASIGPSQPVTSVTSVTIDLTNSDVVYAGTRVDGPGYSDGQVYKITDSGATWTLLNIEEGAPLPPLVSLVAPEIMATYEEVIGVPIQISGVSDPSIISVEIFLGYDSGLLTFDQVITIGTLSAGWTIEANDVAGTGDSRTLKIAAATNNLDITTDGTLLVVQFTVANTRVPDSSPLTLEHVLFNDGTPENTTTDGSVTLVGVNGVLTSTPEQIIPRQTITVTVVDVDADLDGVAGTATDQVTVTVTNSNGDEETLTLVEDAVTAGTFSQTIPTVFGTAENDGDHLIQAQANDLITFTYADALAANGTGPVPRIDQTGVVGGTDGTVDISIASQPGDVVYIKVVDADISTPPLDYMLASTTIDVDVANSTTGQLTVMLSETGAGSGVFVGSLATTSGTEAGKMTTAEEDILTVTYVDDLGVAGEPPVNRTDDNQVLYPWGDADDNDQLQAFDAALTLLEVLVSSTLEGLPELAANVDLDPVGTGITPFDASLILQHRVGLISSFPVQDAISTNHPQPNPASPKPIPKERLLALQVHDGYMSVWAEDRSEILSGDLLMEGLIGPVEMGEELSDFLSASRATEEGLRVVFAGAEATSGPGELLRVYGVGAVDAQLIRVDLNDGSMVARIGETERVDSTPQTFALHPNHPNPFNPETTIRYDVSAAGMVRLRIYDVTGQVVRELVSNFQMAGSYSVVWDGRNADGDQVANSVYLYELRVGDFRAIRKMLLMK